MGGNRKVESFHSMCCIDVCRDLGLDSFALVSLLNR